MFREKRTKIVATMSDFRCSEEFVTMLYKAGMDVVRVNSAHVSEESATKIVETVHKINAAIPIMIDTKGPEIRVTTIADEYDGSIRFEIGDVVAIKGSDGTDMTTREIVYMNVPSIVEDIPVGSRMLIADGELELKINDNVGGYLTGEFVLAGVMKSRKSVNVPGVSISLPSVTAKDRRFIEWAVKNDVDFIAHSFVRSAKDIKAVQDILDLHNSQIKIISKIENQEGLDNIDEIIEMSYGIMVARGDLGVELPAEAIPNTQRCIVEKCIVAKRPVIIATQMLYSMVNSPRPTRAEVSDVASAIYERVDAIMLSDETAMGNYPRESVETMSKIAREIESDERHFTPMVDMNMVSVNHEVTAQLARSTVRACSNLPITQVVLDTKTGRTGRYMAAFRGKKPVVAICYQRHAQRILALSYGIRPFLRTQELNDRYHFLVDAMTEIEKYDTINDNDLWAIVGGSFGPNGGASYIEYSNVTNIRQRNEDIKKAIANNTHVD